MRNMRGLLLLD